MIRYIRMIVISIAVLLLPSCAQADKTEPEATQKPAALEITSPKEGTAIKGNVVELAVRADGVEIVKADGDTTGKTGHFHVFIDKDPVAVGETIPKEAGIVHSTENPIKLTGLSKGTHTLTVVVGDGTHKRIGLPGDDEASSSIEVDVEGPSVDASAPLELAAGQDLTIDVKVDGVTLVGADKDQGPAGTTGHLHVFIDPATPPAADGQAIPKDEKHIHTVETSIKISTSLLPAGDHVIWVVLGDKGHVPFGPLVADKITITVK